MQSGTIRILAEPKPSSTSTLKREPFEQRCGSFPAPPPKLPSGSDAKIWSMILLQAWSVRSFSFPPLLLTDQNNNGTTVADRPPDSERACWPPLSEVLHC